MSIHVTLWALLLALAALIGFAADRAGICTVKAVEEVLSTRRAYLLWSFLKTVMWVIGITALLVPLIGSAQLARGNFALMLPGVFGGFLFGIGAVLNGGCAFSTLTRFGSGNLGMAVTIAGFLVGALVYVQIQLSIGLTPHGSESPWFAPDMTIARVAGVVLGLWMLWESVRLWRTAARQPWRSRLLARRYRLSVAAAIIGVSNGILYALLGTWSYTHTLRLSAEQLIGPRQPVAIGASMPMLWYLFLALLVGVYLSAYFSRRFVLDWKPQFRWLAYFTGGGLMGFGAALVPGGNDVLLLNAIPGFSPHALPAYVAMLAGIGTALIVRRNLGGQWPVVDCRGDLCNESDTGQSNAPRERKMQVSRTASIVDRRSGQRP